MSICDLVVGQHGLPDLGELLKVGLDVLQAGRGRQTADKDLFRAHDQLRVGLSGDGNLRFDDFSIKLLEIQVDMV